MSGGMDTVRVGRDRRDDCIGCGAVNRNLTHLARTAAQIGECHGDHPTSDIDANDVDPVRVDIQGNLRTGSTLDDWFPLDQQPTLHEGLGQA